MRGVLVLLVLVLAAPAGAAVIVPDQPVMRLDDIGLYDVGYAYRGGPEKHFPAGWTGFSEETGVWCQDAGVRNGKRAFLLHCPWRGGTGISFQQFTFEVPKVARVLLRGAVALREDAVGKSDGVTFRIFANTRKLLEVHRVDANWRPFEYGDPPNSNARSIISCIAAHTLARKNSALAKNSGASQRNSTGPSMRFASG